MTGEQFSDLFVLAQKELGPAMVDGVEISEQMINVESYLHAQVSYTCCTDRKSNNFCFRCSVELSKNIFIEMGLEALREIRARAYKRIATHVQAVGVKVVSHRSRLVLKDGRLDTMNDRPCQPPD